MTAQDLASEKLNCQPEMLRVSGYQKGTEYTNGGFDYREVYSDPEGNEIEIFYSHVGDEFKAVNWDE